MAKRDCYEILGVDRNDGCDSKRAYRSLGYKVPSGPEAQGCPERG